jgi:N-acetylneuraminate synthase
MKQQPVFLIAEIAQAHDGSLGILHSFVDAAAEAGADAVKFQVHIADAESSAFEEFRVNFSYVDKTRYDYWKRMELTPEQWAGVKEHCERVGLEFLASTFSVAAARLLERLGVKRFKIASGEVRNYLMLDFIARTGKDIWISSGMSSYAEIEQALNLLDGCGARGNKVLFQCTTEYPTPPERLGLNVIPELQRRFGLPVGLSDHSGCIYPPLAAVAMGARFIECHLAFDKRMFGPDARSSLTVDEYAQMARGVRFLEKALASPVDKDDTERFEGLKTLFGKSLSYARDIPAGTLLSSEDLESRKPAGKGVSAQDFRQLLGKRTKSARKAGSFANWEDVE